jgi:thiol-disulfide isomerase/thioredoxin
MSKTKEETLEVVEETEELSPWYYFYSVGCGWCKKTEPIIDELNKEGHDILKLDLSDSENKKINDELKKEFNTQCGTPWLINADTGKGICGFREKDIIETWLDGKDIPAPPRPKGPMPKPPFQGSTGKEETKWKKEYKKWAEENSHLPKIQSADEILARPRPKSEPPKPPNPQGTDAELETWGKEYDKWKNENGHLPNLQPVESILQRFKQQRDGAQQQPAQNTQVLETKISKLEKRITDLEQKLNDLDFTVGEVDNNPTDWEIAIEDKLNSLLDHLGV